MRPEYEVDKVLLEDLIYIADSSINIESLKNKTIFVTGATGLVGSQIIKALVYCNRLKDANIKIIALARESAKVEKLLGDYLEHSNLSFIYQDIMDEIEIEESIDFIIHGASMTSSKFFVEKPVETIKIALKGTENMLELARKKNVSGMVYLSSMEAYGITDPHKSRIKEEDLGYIDILNVRSSYSEGKRMCECLCAAYASEYKVPVKIARLSQTFGAGISKDENRVFAQFAKSAMNGTDIVLHTEGKSIGNYTYTRDTVIGVLLLLTKGNSGEAYTIVNEESNISIGDMAKMVAKEIAEDRIKVVFDIPEDSKQFGYAPDVQMRLSAEKMSKLGWKAQVGLKESYIRMIESLKQD